MSENTIDVIEEPSGSEIFLLPCYTSEITPEGTELVVVEPTLHQITESREIYLWPSVTSPDLECEKRPGSANSLPRPAKKSRRLRKSRKIDNTNIFSDSGSDSENNNANDVDFVKIRKYTRRLRDFILEENKRLDNEGWDLEVENVPEKKIEDESVMDKRINIVNVLGERNLNVRLRGGAKKAQRTTAAAPEGANFSWSEDFSSFKGQKESYSRVPGPTFSSQDPAAIFLEIWDLEFMEKVVRDTNIYAWEVISQLSDPDIGTGIPNHLESWTNVTVEELYRYFAILVLLSLCHRSTIADYWSTGILGMQEFRSIMSRNRFLLINSFLHFASNKDLLMRGHDRKIEKVASVLNHCNRKFAAMYTPSQHLNVEESLLLGKSRASWKQWSKAARFGITYFELCEAETGYLLQYRLYADESVEMHSDSSAPIVLDLLEGYLDVGHVLIIDNWYNQLPLTRYLKNRCTDVLGTVNHRRKGFPPAIQNLTPNDVDRGMSVSRHCGDIALVAYKNVQLVTIMCTYYQHGTNPGTCAAKEILKPEVVQEYNRYKGGVDLKDRKLSRFPTERHRNRKWYMKVFRRLLNASLLNAFIIYTKNLMHGVSSHRDFRLEVVEGLLSRYPSVSSVQRKVSNMSQTLPSRLQPGNHCPIHTELTSATEKGRRRRRKQLRCVRCSALKRRVCVTYMCELCQVALCLGPCWKEYHSVINLKKIVNVNV